MLLLLVLVLLQFFWLTQKHAFYKAITSQRKNIGHTKSTNNSYVHVHMDCDLFRDMRPNVELGNAAN